MCRARFLAVALALVAPLLTACAGDDPTIALLVDDRSDSSSRAVDVQAFTDRVEATCDACRVTVYDAAGDVGTQRSQARQAEAATTDALVVVPVDPDELASLVSGDVPVVSLGELLPGSDRFVGLAGGEVPVRRGSDLEAAREIVMGEETSMTYVPTRAMTERAADVAIAFLADTTPEGGEDVDGVETWLYEDVEVTLDTLTSVLVADGAITLDDLCAGTTAERCVRWGLR
jgi:ABC-type xylose transport system substrate-binding protein